MLKNKILLAAVTMVTGFGIGWLLKPSGDGKSPDRHEHGAESGTGPVPCTRKSGNPNRGNVRYAPWT